MKTYSHSFDLSSGTALARALRTYLRLGDKLVALEVDVPNNVATGTFEQAGAAPAATDDSVNAARLAARPPSINPN